MPGQNRLYIKILSLIGWGLLGLCHKEGPGSTGREHHIDDKTGSRVQTGGEIWEQIVLKKTRAGQ